MNFPFTIAGFLVGALIGATGVGGGSLMTPLLVMVFGIPASAAVGTDLLFASITKGVGTTLHGLNQSISWRIVGRLAVGSLPASGIMLWLLHNVIDAKALAGVITLALGIALVITSLAIFFQPWMRALLSNGNRRVSSVPSEDKQTKEKRLLAEEIACEAQPQAAALTILTGAFLGAVVTLTSVGAGALGVMALMAMYPKVRAVRIVGTDIAHAVPLTLVAGMGHATMGTVNYEMLGSLLLGSIPGIALGSHLAFRLPERRMKQILAAILFFVGSKLLF